MARDIVTSENRDEFISQKMAEKSGKKPEKKVDDQFERVKNHPKYEKLKQALGKKGATDAILKELNDAQGSKLKADNTHKYVGGNDFSNMKDEDLAKEIEKHHALNKKYLGSYFKEHRGSIPLSEYRKDDREYQDHIGKYMDLLIEEGYRKK